MAKQKEQKKDFKIQKTPINIWDVDVDNIWDIDVDNIVISQLVETNTNF